MESLCLIFLDDIVKNVQKMEKAKQTFGYLVLKSNAYGLGVRPILWHLRQYHFSHFAFNTFKEYQECQDLLIDASVIILGQLTSAQLANLDFNVIHTISSLAEANLISKRTTPTKVHLLIDTGMNRSGIKTLEEAKLIIDYLNQYSKIIIEGIYTHFACSAEDTINYQRQVALFLPFLKLYDFTYIHANASATLHHPLIGNCFRMGLALYGYTMQLPLQKACHYHAKVQMVRELAKNETVGYQYTYQLKKASPIALLGIGYDDGFLNDYVYSNGVLLPVVGKKCMNHAFVDLTKLKMPGKYPRYLSIWPKCDIIYQMAAASIYMMLVASKKTPKVYIQRINYELFRTYQAQSETGQSTSQRSRSHPTFSLRTVAFRRGYFFSSNPRDPKGRSD